MKTVRADLDKDGHLNELHGYAETTEEFTLIKITKTYCSSVKCSVKGSYSKKGTLVDEAEDAPAPYTCPKCYSRDHLFYASKRIKK